MAKDKFEIKRKKLTNFNIIERQDFKGNDYFIIFDEDGIKGQNAYFCWKDNVETGFEDLKNNRHNWKEIEIEWEARDKGNKVINIWSDTNQESFLI